jgi:hypothetical protein
MNVACCAASVRSGTQRRGRSSNVHAFQKPTSLPVAWPRRSSRNAPSVEGPHCPHPQPHLLLNESLMSRGLAGPRREPPAVASFALRRGSVNLLQHGMVDVVTKGGLDGF